MPYRVDVLETIPSERINSRKELYASAYVKDDTYTIVLINSSLTESFSTLLKSMEWNLER